MVYSPIKGYRMGLRAIRRVPNYPDELRLIGIVQR